MATKVELEDLLVRLDANGADKDPTYQENVALALRLTGVTDEAVCREFDISRASVARWREGKATSHPSMRFFVNFYFVAEAKRLLGSVEA